MNNIHNYLKMHYMCNIFSFCRAPQLGVALVFAAAFAGTGVDAQPVGASATPAVQDQVLSPNAQAVEVSPYAVIERGPHHKRIAHVLALTNNLGRVIYRTNGYTEIGTGMNHLVNGDWVESQENIDITANGAQATNAAHSVFFSGNANAQEAIRLIMPGGLQQLSSHVVSLSYLDPVTGAMAVISQLQDSIGQLVSPGEGVMKGSVL